MYQISTLVKHFCNILLELLMIYKRFLLIHFLVHCTVCLVLTIWYKNIIYTYIFIKIHYNNEKDLIKKKKKYLPQHQQ